MQIPPWGESRRPESHVQIPNRSCRERDERLIYARRARACAMLMYTLVNRNKRRLRTPAILYIRGLSPAAFYAGLDIWNVLLLCQFRERGDSGVIGSADCVIFCEAKRFREIVRF